jgi:hypothetical protein
VSIGHFGVAFAAKRVAPRASLGLLFLAAELIDLLWPIFVLLGLEHVRIAPGNTVVTPLDFYDYPITHSLVGAAGWSVVLGLVYFAVRRYSRGAWAVGLCVVSHWFLDAVVHRPDLLLVPGGATRIGLGLWNSRPGTVLVESGIFVAGLVLYLRTTTGADRVGCWGFWSLIGFLVLIALFAWTGAPPPSDKAVAASGLGLWLLVAWAHWADHHRASGS